MLLQISDFREDKLGTKENPFVLDDGDESTGTQSDPE